MQGLLPGLGGFGVQLLRYEVVDKSYNVLIGVRFKLLP